MNDALTPEVSSNSSPAIRIDVLGDSVSRQARTYAEYRLFAALTALAVAGPSPSARLILRPAGWNHGCARVTCTLTVTLPDARTLRIRTTGDHAYAAINRAVERLRAQEIGA